MPHLDAESIVRGERSLLKTIRAKVSTGANRNIHSLLLLSITLCTVFTLLLSSSIYYFSYSRISLEQMYRFNLSHLMQTSKEVVNMTESAQTLSFQMYRSSAVSKLMYYADLNIFDRTAAMTELSNYLNSMPFIESIYVYNAKSDLFFISSNRGQNGYYAKHELIDTGILNVLAHFQEYKPFTPIPRSYAYDASATSKTGVYTYLCFDAIGSEEKMNSAVIVNISAAWINKEIGRQSGGADSGRSYILDDRDRVLTGGELQPVDTQGADGGLASLLNQRIRNHEAGYLVTEVEGTKSLISYTSPDVLGWQYVRITPYELITKQIDSVRAATFGIAAAILIAGLFFSWLLSRLLYIPIRRIVHQVNTLETEVRNQLYPLKQSVLRSIVLGSQPLAKKAHNDKLKQAGIALDFHAAYRLLLLKIDGFEAFRQSHGSDLMVYKFAIMNISSEIASASYQVETVDMDEDSVVLLLNLREPTAAAETEQLQTAMRQIQSSTQDYLKIGLSVTYSPVGSEPAELPAMYKQVKEASLHRLFFGRTCIIDAETILALRSKEYIFPVEKEKKLADSLRAANTGEAKRMFANILQDTAQYPIHALQLAYSNLTTTIKNVISTIEKNSPVPFTRGLRLTMPPLEQFETIDEIVSLYFALFDELSLKQAEKRSMKQEDLVRKINELIEGHYDDPNLCLNWIADELDMSPTYISRVYKQQTLTAVGDVINGIRLQKAKELLEQTHLPLAAIVERIGYTSTSYLHRMFKKSFGVTPAEYRKARLG